MLTNLLLNVGTTFLKVGVGKSQKRLRQEWKEHKKNMEKHQKMTETRKELKMSNFMGNYIS